MKSDNQIDRFLSSLASDRAKKVYELDIESAASKTLEAIKDLCGLSTTVLGCGSLSGVWGEAFPDPKSLLGASLRFVCAEGFLEPTETTICVQSGESLVWFGATECFEGISSLCEVINSAEWGSVDYDGRTEGTELIYSCEYGYVEPIEKAVCKLVEGKQTWDPAASTRCQGEQKL